QLTGLVPNGSGVIEFTVTKSSGATYAFLNAVVLQEYDNDGTVIRPADLFTDINAPGVINLSWSDRSSNETGFEIYRATSGSAFSLLTTTAANVTYYTDNTAQKNVRYYYKVRAKGAVNSDYSNTVNAKLGNNLILLNLNLATPQASPWNNTNGTPQTGAGFNNMANTLGNSTGYAFKLTNDWGGYFDLGMTGGILPDNVMLTSWWIEGNSQPATMRFENLDQSKRYRIGFMGSSSWDGDFTASYTINGQTVYLNSNKNNSKIVYVDNVATNSDGEINITMGYLAATRWSFLSAVIIESYDDDNGAPGPQNVNNSVTRIGNTTSTKDVEVEMTRVAPKELEISAYPNPFNQTIGVNLSIPKSSRVALRIMDMNGRLIYNQDLGSVQGSRTVNLNGSELDKLTPGAYILQVLKDGKIEKTIKMLKAR
ncbi:MAG TPA: T9SS type A sorting domain-containing protein, partial [Flavisolibacter sp.]|nr:T9SS type A sorting domain-containing protein [Flavisolibacter sp.]